METEAEDHFVEELIQKMDTNVDGKIDYQEFVHFVRNCGTADILSTQNSRSSGNSSPRSGTQISAQDRIGRGPG